MLHRILAAGGLAGSSLLGPLAAGAAPAPAEPAPQPEPDDGMCVVTTVSQGGREVVDESSLRCYPTLAEALAAPEPRGLFTIAAHYPSTNGDGTPILVKGTSCATTWNPSETWRDSVSSTGVSTACTGAKHYTATNCSGSFQITSVALPMVTNLNSALNNNVGCVKYS